MQYLYIFKRFIEKNDQFVYNNCLLLLKKELMNVFSLYVLIFIVMLFIGVIIIFRYYKYGYLYQL